MRRGTIIALSVVLTQAACASAPPAPARADIARGISSTTTLAATAQHDFGTPPGVVLTDGVTVDEAVATALWNNADFQLALTQLDLARTDLVQAGMLRNPVLSMLMPWGPKQFEATLNLPIDMIWQRPRRIREASLNAQAVAARLTATGAQLAGDVRVTFAQLTGDDQLLAVATEQAAAARELQTLADGRVRAGDISALDARMVATDAARLDQQRHTRALTRDLTMNELRRLMGVPVQTPTFALDVAAAASAGRCGAPAELVRVALASRPDVRAAEIDVEGAAARAGVEASKIATLTAILDANAQGKEGFEAGPGLAAELPIFSRNDGPRARAAAELDQAGRRYQALRARISADMEAAAIRLDHARAAGARWNGADGATLDAALREVKTMRDAGEISTREWLEARQRLADASMQRAEARAAVRREQARLELVLGRACQAQ